jgi:small subunit ribosomal protein S21
LPVDARPRPCGVFAAAIHFEKEKEKCVVKLKVRDSESIHEAVRRFRKLVERSGIKKEMRRKEYYEKPSDTRRRARLRAERRARRNRLLPAK